MEQSKTARFHLEVDYDPNVTDAESLERGLNRMLDGVLDSPGILDDYGEVEVGRLEEVDWADDSLQFMRLLGEMASVMAFSEEQYKALQESMDLERKDIDALLERAQNAWDAHKAGLLSTGDPSEESPEQLIRTSPEEVLKSIEGPKVKPVRRVRFIAPTGSPIDGTLETLKGRATAHYFNLHEDGTVDPDYEGETNIFYEEQKTVFQNGEMVLLDEDGDDWRPSECTVEDAPPEMREVKGLFEAGPWRLLFLEYGDMTDGIQVLRATLHPKSAELMPSGGTCDSVITRLLPETSCLDLKAFAQRLFNKLPDLVKDYPKGLLKAWAEEVS